MLAFLSCEWMIAWIRTSHLLHYAVGFLGMWTCTSVGLTLFDSNFVNLLLFMLSWMIKDQFSFLFQFFLLCIFFFLVSSILHSAVVVLLACQVRQFDAKYIIYCLLEEFWHNRWRHVHFIYHAEGPHRWDSSPSCRARLGYCLFLGP